VVTASTGGAGNIPVSMTEDAVSTSLSLAAIAFPILVATLLVVVGAFVIWWLWRKWESRLAT
jgi:hypothetical protein